MNRLEILLDNYFKETISANEMELLRQLSDICDDTELKHLFQKQWNSHSVPPEYEKEEIKRISAQIHSRLQRKKEKTGWTTFIRVAATVLLLFTTGISVYLTIDNREMTVLGEREVVVKADKGQRVGITLPDGSTVQLNSESVVSYRQDFGKESRTIKFSGEGFFEVVKNKNKKFVINSRFMNVEVLGTSFNFYAYESKDEVELTLINGKVFLTTTTLPVQSTVLEPNNKAVYNKKTGKLHVGRTNTVFETAWRTKELVFRSESLASILLKLEKRYGVCFVINNQQLLDDRYTGVFDKEELDDVLKILDSHFHFSYKTKQDTISIYRVCTKKVTN